MKVKCSRCRKEIFSEDRRYAVPRRKALNGASYTDPPHGQALQVKCSCGTVNILLRASL